MLEISLILQYKIKYKNLNMKKNGYKFNDKELFKVL